MKEFTATYSPDDNKIRLYAASRLPRELYDRVRAAGFIWAPKQEFFVAPMWTPGRADLAEELAGEIGDEDTSLAERAEVRAERFDGYSGKRADDAQRAQDYVHSISDGIPLGQPILIGHHSEKHARKDAERIENGMRKAVKMWETSQYWTNRAAGALAHAKYAERPDVRARRIKTIEAARRKTVKETAEADTQLKMWADMDTPEKFKRQGEAVTLREVALFIANHCHISKCFTLAEYPRATEEMSKYEGSMSIWSALDYGIITPEQAREICVRVHTRGNAHRARWLEHYDNRLAYERAMLGETGYITPPKNPTRAALPILNYADETQYRTRWSNDVITCKPHGMTRAEFAKIGSDYNGTYISADGTHRVRSAVIGSGTVRGLSLVYLTDSKIHAKPGGELKTKEQQETAARIEKGRRVLDAQVEASRKIRAHNKAVIAGADTDNAPARTHTAPPSEVDAMRASLKAGVQVVSAPQLFPTPAELCARMVELAEIAPGARVLEPSAGTGNILRALPDHCESIAVELNRDLAFRLCAFDEPWPHLRCTYAAKDFLQCNGSIGLFDRIVMNPPFKDGADIKHIQHARSMLKEGGRLVAICANGPRQRDQLMPLADLWEDLPAGTFADQGTNVNTALLVING